MHQPGVEFAISRSQVQNPNQHTNELIYSGSKTSWAYCWSVSIDNVWLPVSFHIWDCKALFLISLTHISTTKASGQTFAFYPVHLELLGLYSTRFTLFVSGCQSSPTFPKQFGSSEHSVLYLGIYHDGHKVYNDGHSNENVKEQQRIFKKSPNSWSYRLQKTCLWPSWVVAVIVEPIYLPHPVRVFWPLGTQDILWLVSAKTVKVQLLVQVGRSLRAVRFAVLIWVTLEHIETQQITAVCNTDNSHLTYHLENNDLLIYPRTTQAISSKNQSLPVTILHTQFSFNQPA